MITLVRSRHHTDLRHDMPSPDRIDVQASTGQSRRVGCEPLFQFPGRPGGMTVDADGVVYLSVADPATIWQIGLDGTARPLLRPGVGGERLYSPGGIASAADGSLVVADTSAHRISSVGMDGAVRVLAGGSSGLRDGHISQAAFRFPRAVAVGADGTVFVADAGNDRVRAVSAEGQVTTLAGSIYDYGDGTGSGARFRRPSGLAIDTAGGLYVADTGNNAIRHVLPDGRVTTVAGSPPGGDSDGVGRAAGLRWPAAVAVGDDGWLWVADYGNSTVRLVDPAGRTATVFEIAGLGWPTAVVALPGHRAAVAGSALGDGRDRNGCLMVIGGWAADGNSPRAAPRRLTRPSGVPAAGLDDVT